MAECARIFISRAGADAEFASKVAVALRAVGVETVLQDENFGHQNFMDAMDEALRDSATRVLALISKEYLASDYCRIEAKAALAGDPTNRAERLIAILVSPTAPDGVLTDIAYISVVRDRHLGEIDAAIKKILGACGFGEGPKPEEKKRKQTLHPQIRMQPRFAGRDAELATIAKALFGDGEAERTAAISALRGVGGVGKTTLAKEYAWRNRERYHGVWWIAAASRDGLINGLISLGDQLLMTGLVEEEDREAAAHRVLRAIESDGAAQPWLLVYDNVEDPAHLEDLTPRENAHLLMTSRRADWRDASEVLALDPLPADIAVDYLCAQAGREDRVGATALAEALGRLPLALEQAALYCREVRTVDFRQYHAKVEAYLAKPHRDDEQAGVIATFSLAIEELAKKRPEAARLLEMMSFCAPNAIPLDLFVTNEQDLEAVGEQAAELARYCLIAQRDLPDGGAGADMHRLVQAAGRARAPKGRLDAVLNALKGRQSGKTDMEIFATFATGHAHLLAAMDYAAAQAQPTAVDPYDVFEAAMTDLGQAVAKEMAAATREPSPGGAAADPTATPVVEASAPPIPEREVGAPTEAAAEPAPPAEKTETLRPTPPTTEAPIQPAPPQPAVKRAPEPAVPDADLGPGAPKIESEAPAPEIRAEAAQKRPAPNPRRSFWDRLLGRNRAS
ncbi:MAG: toll/interleukin-1 receptor domain-containing protein [Neomegalonema sp.]|nr:toll/interleukin-1 receptor domain-containing protein [Neomegalonema sp.]